MREAIVAAEAAECGLACLAMIAAHHGQHYTLRELRQRFPTSMKGVTLARLIAIASELGLQGRALRIELDQLEQLAMPCVLHWDLSHFVVLLRSGRRGITVLDPASGLRELSYAQASAHFTGVALELSPTADFRPRPASPAIGVRELTGPVDGLAKALGLVLVLSLSLQVFVVLAPFYLQWVVDQVLVSADRGLLVVLGLGFGCVLLLQVGTGVLRGWTVVYLSARLGLAWAGNVFIHLQKLGLDFFHKRQLADIVSRMNSIQSIQRTLTTSFVEGIVDGLMAAVTLAMMLLYSAKLALVTLAAVALYFILRLAAFRGLRDGTEKQLLAAARQQGHLLESIRGAQSVKLAGAEAERRSVYFNLMHESVGSDVRVARLGLGFGAANQIIFGIERIAVIWIAAHLAMRNVFSVGMLIAYLAYKDQFALRVAGLVDKCMELRMLRLHGERLADIVLSEAEAEVVCAALPAVCRIEVEALGFRYGAGEAWVVEDCSFVVEEGESVAIVGASGSGKTTLVKLMLGLLVPERGRICLGGRDLAQIGARNYRKIVGAVMQDDQLFAGSLADNIAFGDVQCDLQRVEEAARLAAVHDEIQSMPMGYHSLVGDMGTVLSGGQKQRVILARALYRNPRILFLDEATSHLDVERERLVNDAVRDLRLTKVIIAHRPETIASADRVLLLRDGRIVPLASPQRLHDVCA
ncbi:ATP-binding cassette subfamily B protein RaxB [Tahibacter aquaticus]|uniref:ATP-binding cassette subfamily B protein RaxB n=1 Tax=Tahibacter aquaticus TaxID=520092 RepID=A0A4R6YRL5_9GAMM|nr:peptidase domain-containing ABC transporter [Tahibacter aquaticus]TDR40755.1 ATP-binding cassette subfamily B protein RaxB [Tahibacter aquaticus]